MDGARTAEGGEGVTGAMIRARLRVDGRLAGDLQALLGAPMAACSGCGERDGGKDTVRDTRTGWRELAGTFGWQDGGPVADGVQRMVMLGEPPRMLRSPGRIRRPAIIRRLFLETGEVEWIELKGNSNVGTSATFLDQLSKRYVGAWVAAGKTSSLRGGDTKPKPR